MARIAIDATTPMPNWPRCKPCGDRVAERARADEPGDHDDGEDHDDPLVDRRA